MLFTAFSVALTRASISLSPPTGGFTPGYYLEALRALLIDIFSQLLMVAALNSYIFGTAPHAPCRTL